MRPFSLVASLVCIAVLGTACAAEEVTPQKSVKRGTTKKPVGEDNENGEHGKNTPAGPGATPDEGTAVTSETWANGKAINANIVIPAGETVEIAPGATVTVGANVAITVKGTLKAAITGAHAKLTGASWVGIVVANGGTLTTSGLDIEGAQSGLWTQEGNKPSTFENAILKAASPFKMEAGSNITVNKVTATATGGGSAIAGNFKATHLNYDKADNPGLTISDPEGTMDIADSKFTGLGVSGDYIISSNAKLIKLEYTEINDSHCALHFNAVTKYTIDHVSLIQNTYAAMFYGSGAGPNTVTASNFIGIIHFDNENGPTSITGTKTAGGEKNVDIPEGTLKNEPAANVPGAQPRQ